MNINKKELIAVNSGFGGSLRNQASIEYALSKFDSARLGPFKKTAYLVRAILVDHPFTDGNKRTAAYVVLRLADGQRKAVDTDSLLHHLVSISKHNIHQINIIERRLRSVFEEDSN